MSFLTPKTSNSFAPQEVEDHIKTQCNDFNWAAIVGANSTRKFSELVRTEFDSISPQKLTGGGKTVRYKGRSGLVNGWHIFNAALPSLKERAKPAEPEASSSNKRDRDAQEQEGASSNSDAEPSGKRPRQDAEEDDAELDYADDDDE
jgi:hypothetical protein